MIIRITPRDIPVSPAALRNQLTSRLASAPPLPATTVPTVPVDFTHTMDPSYSGGLRLTAPTEAQAAVAQVNVIDTGSERPSSEASSELDSGPGTEGGGLPRSSSDDEGSAPMTFDMSQAAAHVYLGDREDLDGSACEPLEDGQLVRLPLYVVPDMVLVPGATLPMRVSGPLRALVEAAMDALPPLKNLISVVCVHRDVECGALVVPSTGCIAVLRQMQAEGPTQYTNCLAVGLQRMRVNIDMELPWFVAGIHQVAGHQASSRFWLMGPGMPSMFSCPTLSSLPLPLVRARSLNTGMGQGGGPPVPPQSFRTNGLQRHSLP